MSGHNKWSTIKHKKGAADAKRGQLFTKLIKEITLAARLGGSDISGNPRLRQAVLTAKQNSMPSDNIDRAIKKGTGELEGVAIEEITYEGYGPAGIAVIIETTTDNRNRTTAELRHALSRNGGSMGEQGCVSWGFDRKGVIYLDSAKNNEDEIMTLGLDIEGFDDVEVQDEELLVYTDPTALYSVREELVKNGIEPVNAKLEMIPQQKKLLTGKEAVQALRLVEKLEENDDVVTVYANFDIDESEVEKLMEE